MRENIKLNRPEFSQDLIEFTAEEKKEKTGHAQDIMLALGMMEKEIDENRASLSTLATYSKVLESHVRDLLKLVKYDSVLVYEAEERYKEVRRQNTIIRDLERELEQKAFQNIDIQDVSDMLSFIEVLIKNQLKTRLNFGINEIHVNQCGINCKINIYNFDHDHPERVAKMNECFDITVLKEGHISFHLTERNIAVLRELLNDIGFSIIEIETKKDIYLQNPHDNLIIDKVHIECRDLSKMKAMKNEA